jgi:FKBP-type peptidyl-prolyl cis-trans isomerase (trigger factor)
MQKTELEAIAKNFVRKTLPDSEVEFVGEVPYEAVGAHREEALVHIAEQVEMPGFRKGKVPHNMVLQKVGETGVLEEAAEHFLSEFYPILVEQNKIDAIGRPDIRITKLAPNNPVALTIRTAVYPDTKLGNDWKKLGSQIVLEQALPATEEEVSKTLEEIRQSRKQGEVVPELTDEFAKSVGAFLTLDALKEQIKKGITEEKERKARETRRGKIIDTLLDKTKVEIPKIFVESELEKILAQMKEDIARFKIPFDAYLKQVNKTEEDLRSDFREQAKKRAKLQLTLNKIAEEEKIEADKEAVEGEIKHALEHFPDAKPDLVRIHIETVLRNEKVLKLLEENR